MDQSLVGEVQAWIADDPDPSTASQLQQWLDTNNEAELRASFNGFLQFGTAGLRGPIRPGPSGMNRAVVGRTAAGIVAYMKERNLTSVVIGRDARYGSEDYTFETAEIMSGAGVKVFVLPRPLPTPVLAFATNELSCDVGIMVTASHNPPQDNGYKVYLGGTVDGIEYRGSQIVSPTDVSIAQTINAITSLKSQPRGKEWTVLGEEIIEKYIDRTASLATKPGSLRIVYTAMHGVGTETLQRVFLKAGFQTPILVDAQAAPDPDFPTVAFPNPEEPGAIDLALETAKSFDADLVIANDPDADRCAAAVKDPAKGWRMLWYIILPQLKPATFIAMVVTVIGALRSFDLISIMTNGGPWGSSRVLAFYMYEQAFSEYGFRMGYGAAIAVVLFAIMMIYIVAFLIKMYRDEKGQ